MSRRVPDRHSGSQTATLWSHLRLEHLRPHDCSSATATGCARRCHRAIRDGNYEQAIEAYAGQRYTQHSTPVKDGKEGFIEFFADFVQRKPIRDIEIVRCFEDGPYVFLHVLQTLNNGEFRYVTADIFDTDDDAKLIEHWDIITEFTEACPAISHAHAAVRGARY